MFGGDIWIVDSVDSNFETSHLSGYVEIVVDTVDRGDLISLRPFSRTYSAKFGTLIVMIRSLECQT